MTDLIIVAVLLVLLSAAIGYVVRKKRSGAMCIGCPDAERCRKNCGCK